MSAPDQTDDPTTYETTLPAEPGSAPLARSAVERHCGRWDLSELCDDATLIVSELVSNAVRHAGTVIGLRLRRTDRGIRLEVTDGSVRPIRRTTPGVLDEGGRGLALVDALATHYGVEGHPGGKTVWAELRT